MNKIENQNYTIIGKFIADIEEIKNKAGQFEFGTELVFRAYRKIEGIDKFIEFIGTSEITNEKINEFLKKEKEIEHPEKFKSFIDNFINAKEFKTKKLYQLSKFWIKYEIPDLFSSSKLINSERAIYKDFIASNPNEFNDMTTFDILTKMRHYEVPNRLLDVTFDPLLALYFSRGKYDDNKKKYNGSGTIFVYLVNKNNIKYYDSDTVTILSMLTKLKKEHKEQLKKILGIFKKENGEYYNSRDTIKITINGERIIRIDKKELVTEKDTKINVNTFESKMKITMGKENKEIENFEIDKDSDSNFTVKYFFNFLLSNCIGELIWQLKQEIPGWYEGIFDLETFTQCYLVKPKMNNPRIVAQSGAFFIYPFEDTDITRSLVGFGFTQVDINKLKEELKILNIKETKYIPDDLAKYAKEIREKYS